MAYKKVSGSRTAEIRLDGSVYTVDFGCCYNYYAVRNDSDSVIYVSTADKSCTPNNDGVVSIPSGGGYVHYNGFAGSSEIYISGTGGALVVAQDDGMCPFKLRGKGGDDGFSGDYNDLTNKPDIPVPSEVIDSNSTNETVSTSKAVLDYVIASDNTALASANSYTDTAIANLVGTAPETLNTLEELATAVQNNETVVEALDSAITNKADKASLSAHTDNKNNPHEVKPYQIEKSTYVSCVGKTVAKFKEELLNWWTSSRGTLDVYRFVGGGQPSWWLLNFLSDEAVIPEGYTYTIIPIVDYGPANNYATFLFSTVSENGDSKSILKLELIRGQFTHLSKLVDNSLINMTGILPIEKGGTENSEGMAQSSKIFNIGAFNGKTVQALKNALKQWWKKASMEKQILGYFLCDSSWVKKFNDDDAVLSGASVWQVTPIGGYALNGTYGGFLCSAYGNSLYLLSYQDDVFYAPKKILTSDDIAPAPFSITDPNFDWNSLTRSGFYDVSFEGGITSDSHGPEGASSWGVLEVISAGARVMQRYTNISNNCYIRLSYNSSWREWCVLSYQTLSAE